MARVDSSFIVVNNESGTAVFDAVSDLVTYISSRSSEEDTKALRAAVELLLATVKNDAASNTEPTIPKDSQPAFLAIAEHSVTLLKSPPAEFESVLNLLWYVLSVAPDFNSLIPVAVSKLTEPLPKAVAQQVALVAVLSSLFNIIPAKSEQKPAVFAKVVSIAAAARSVEQFVPQLPLIAQWIHSWSITPAEKEKIATTLAGALKPAKYSGDLRAFLVALVKLEPELSSVAKLLALEVLRGNISQYDADAMSILTLPGVQKLKGNSDNIYEAVEAISQGDYAAFSKLSNSEITSNTQYATQARVATVSRLASNTAEGKLTYAEIAAATETPHDIETLLVEVIKSGVVNGRMDQLNEEFVVESCTIVGPVTDKHWDDIDKRLSSWQRVLATVLKAVEPVGNNFEQVKALNKLEIKQG